MTLATEFAPARPAADRPPPTIPTPHLELDVGLAVERFHALAAGFGPGVVHYAVKANPHPALLAALAAAGSRFDVASPAEVAACLSAGATADDLLYSNPVKRRSDLVMAAVAGVRSFVADSPAEVDKQAATAPGSRVLARLATSGAGSDWPLSGKFGCTVDEAVALLERAADRGLEPVGVAFHVGSQQHDPERWGPPLAAAAAVFAALAARGIALGWLDLGGGLPAAHEGAPPPLQDYVDRIHALVAQHFGDRPLRLVLEPGRGVVGDAGTVVTEVLGVTWRGGRRWVYVDVGVYTGLVETLGESIRYRLSSERGGPLGPAVLAGPTCDSVDVLYERTPVQLPLDLREGDRLRLHSAGAYTTSYSTVGFNGFAPLPTVLV